MKKENYPEIEFLEKFWNKEKNSIPLIDGKLEIKYKYWWFCQDFDHSFTKTIRLMQKDQKCLVCNGKQLLAGFNDFETAGKKYMIEWDYKKNTIKPYEVLKSSKTLIWWKCFFNHSWQVNTQDKIRNRGGCPYCKNVRLLKGFNDLASQNPELLKEWDYEKNEKTPEEITCSSGIKVRWICQKDNRHKWEEKPFNRTNKTRNWGCPYCVGKRVLAGVNDLATTHPHWLEEWDYEKNDEININPTKLTYGSSKEAYWLCRELKHSWKVEILARNKYGCPVCTNRKVLQGYNDFASQAPQELLNEWDYEKNILKPTEIILKSEKVVWWKCPKKHSYEMPIYQRVTLSYGCRKCSNNGMSKLEKGLLKYIESLLPNYNIKENTRNIIKPYELDIYIPELNIAFEFNGTYWHSDEVIFKRSGLSADEFHKMKTDMCAKLNIKLIHISEKDWIENNETVLEMIRSEIQVRTHSKTLKNTL